MQSTPIGGIDSAEQFLPARHVWQRYSISDMTLWRWLRNPELGFPQPIKIGRHRYWRLADLVSWERSRCSSQSQRLTWKSSSA
jgi:predicted DNA-binding transcriptional regulator AlpA